MILEAPEEVNRKTKILVTPQRISHLLSAFSRSSTVLQAITLAARSRTLFRARRFPVASMSLDARA